MPMIGGQPTGRIAGVRSRRHPTRPAAAARFPARCGALCDPDGVGPAAGLPGLVRHPARRSLQRRRLRGHRGATVAGHDAEQGGVARRRHHPGRHRLAAADRRFPAGPHDAAAVLHAVARRLHLRRGAAAGLPVVRRRAVRLYRRHHRHHRHRHARRRFGRHAQPGGRDPDRDPVGRRRQHPARPPHRLRHAAWGFAGPSGGGAATGHPGAGERRTGRGAAGAVWRAGQPAGGCRHPRPAHPGGLRRHRTAGGGGRGGMARWRRSPGC